VFGSGGVKKLLKDLLYNRDNQHLDISRLSLLLAVLTFLGATIYHIYSGHALNFTEWGAGWTALAAGSAGWIFARQKFEKGAE